MTHEQHFERSKKRINEIIVHSNASWEAVAAVLKAELRELPAEYDQALCDYTDDLMADY